MTQGYKFSFQPNCREGLVQRSQAMNLLVSSYRRGELIAVFAGSVYRLASLGDQSKGCLQVRDSKNAKNESRRPARDRWFAHLSEAVLGLFVAA
jgi:hypothetical protein